MRSVALAVLVLALSACDSAAPPANVATAPSGPPAAIDTPPPEYPEALACAGVGGTVQLRVNVETDGHIRQVEVQQGSGNADLDAVAVKSVKTWKFQPAMVMGKPIAKWIAVPMTFHVPQPRPQHCFVLDEQQRGSLKPE